MEGASGPTGVHFPLLSGFPRLVLSVNFFWKWFDSQLKSSFVFSSIFLLSNSAMFGCILDVMNRRLLACNILHYTING